jgi:hypothetical protein
VRRNVRFVEEEKHVRELNSVKMERESTRRVS